MQRKPDFVIHGGDHVAGSGEDDRDPGIAESWRHYHRLMDPIAAQCPL
jgi:hypothetical protein